MLNSRLNQCALLACAVLLSACSGTVKTVPNERLSTVKVPGLMRVLVVPDAKIAGDAKMTNELSLAELNRRLVNNLEAKRLASSAGSHVVEVTVTDFRIRPVAIAVLFGIMGGTDYLNGTVRLKNASGNMLRTFEVSASYGLGGFGGGQNDMRVGWLYDKFVELTVLELEKSVSEAPAGASLAPGAAPNAAAPSVTPTAAAAVNTNKPTIDNVAAIPKIGPGCRKWYQETWLSYANPRAFVISDSGHCFGSYSLIPGQPELPKDPIERALFNCKAANRPNCVLYAIDDKVVYFN